MGKVNSGAVRVRTRDHSVVHHSSELSLNPFVKVGITVREFEVIISCHRGCANVSSPQSRVSFEFVFLIAPIFSMFDSKIDLN